MFYVYAITQQSRDIRNVGGIMCLTNDEYINVATKIMDSETDAYLLELQGIIEYKLLRLGKEE